MVGARIRRKRQRSKKKEQKLPKIVKSMKSDNINSGEIPYCNLAVNTKKLTGID